MKFLDNEEVYFRMKPHFISQFGPFLFWLLIIVLSTITLHSNQHYQNFFLYLGVPGAILQKLPEPALMHLCVCLIAFLRFAPFLLWREFAAFVSFQTICFFVGFRYPKLLVNLDESAVFLISVAVLMIILCEIQRASTSYLVTNLRIVFKRIGFKHVERTLFYDKIQDLFITRSFIGTLFGYGTIIPVTASQIGTGSSENSLNLGVGGSKLGLGGGISAGIAESATKIVEQPANSLYCIPDVENAYNKILALMQKHC